MEKFIHGGNVYGVSPVGSWLDFSANINPLGLSPSVKAAVAENIAGIVNYPDPAAAELKNALAEHYFLKTENIILGNGAAELFYLFFHTVRPKKVIIPVPSFSEYERAAKASGAELEFVHLTEENNFALDIAALKEKMTDADCVIIGNPNNPTGNLLEIEKLTELAETAQKENCYLIVDESFLDFLADKEKFSLMKLAEKYDKIMVIRSLTKFYAIPGLRLGFGVASEEMVNRLDKHKDVWNVNFLAQKAGVAALSDTEYQASSQNFVTAEKMFLYAELSKLAELKVFAPSVNFILLKTKTMTAAQLTAKMRGRGILIRDCSNYEGFDEHFIRVAVRTHGENLRLLDELKMVLEEAGK